LYYYIRACFVAKGDSLTAYCRRNGIFRENARDALVGIWNGPAAVELRRKLLQAAESDA